MENKRYSLPFEIAPKLRINNYFDNPFKVSDLENTSNLNLKISPSPSQANASQMKHTDSFK